MLAHVGPGGLVDLGIALALGGAWLHLARRMARREFAPGGSAAQVQPGTAKGKSDAEIDKAAKTYMRQHKVDYAEALSAVTSSFAA